MTCKKCENLLPAYLDDALTAGEKKCIADHLASCNPCRQIVTDLKKTMAILQDLRDVEPPPFLEKRIMAQVRAAAGRKQGILRRLFYPLHIKIPVQALATGLVAVLAFYVYQQGGPGMKPMPPFSLPKVEREKGPMLTDASRDTVGSATDSPNRPIKSARPLEENRQPWAPPPAENGAGKDRMLQRQAPDPEELTLSGAPQALDTVRKETPRPADQAEIVGKEQAKTNKQASDALLAAPPVEPRRQQKKAEREIAAPENRKMASAALPPKAMTQSFIDVALHVPDRRVAVRQIEDRLDEAGARIIERRREGNQDILRVEIAAPHVHAFLEQLRMIGGMRLIEEPASLPDGMVTLTIRLTHP